MDKLSKRLDHMINYEHDDFFVNINIDKIVEKILYDYQLLHLYNLVTAFRFNNVILDGSDAGCGKTYTSGGLCKQLNLRPIIICPKIITGVWAYVLSLFSVEPLCIINYESIIAGRSDDKDISKYLKVEKINVTKTKVEYKYEWIVPRNCIVIFDEVHRCKNKKTHNAKLLLSTKKLNYVLMLSATLTDKQYDFNIFGYMLGLYKDIKKGNAWIKAKLYEDSISMNKNKLSAICSTIYPNKGSRMQLSELKDKFPSNKVIANAYQISDVEIKEIEKFASEFKKTNQNDLVLFGKMRQYIENVKVNIIKDLIFDNLEEGFSIVVFLNYTESINKLALLCNTDCIVNGEISMEKREENINAFQTGQQKLIICNMSVESISLHDVHGISRRLSLISPNFSSTRLIQALARIYRTGSQSSCLQKIIFCKGTFEENMCNRIKSKLEFVEKLNSNELIEIEGL